MEPTEEGGMADEDPARYSRRAVLTAMVAGAAVAGAAGVGIGTVVAADDEGGGGGGGGSGSSGSDLKLDRTPVSPLARSQHATSVLPGGLILCIGGTSPGGTLASCQVYNREDDEWYDAAPLARPRSFHSATPLSNGTVLVLGGLDGEALSVASVFDPSTDEWSRVKPLATPRYNHAATALSDGRVVLTGGFHQGPLTAAEIYELEG